MRMDASRGNGAFFRSGEVRQGLLKAGVIVLGAGVVGLVVYMSFRGGEPQGAMPEGMSFQCSKCKALFVKQTGKEPGSLTVQELNTQPQSLRVDCPNCNAVRAGVPTLKCPKCGNPYAPASYTDPAGKAAGRVKDVCPKCGTDRDEFFARSYSKKR